MDQNQIAAVMHLNGPALVVAGPGCGKTKVISERINYLTTNKKISGKNIVAISFTRFSSRELKERTILLNNNLTSVFYGTFHSFFLNILIRYSSFTYDCVIDENEKKSLLRKILLNKLNLNPVSSDFLTSIISEIEKEILNSSKSYTKSLESEAKTIIDVIIKSYAAWKIKNKRLDFNDILYTTYDLLYNNEDILKELRKKFKYFIIDEFQDINEIQYKIIKLLIQGEDNLFVVGDEDQAIYSFRGSNPKYITDFLNDFPKGKIYKIVLSYRCPQSILRLSNNLISNNKYRTEKDIITFNNFKGITNIVDYENETNQAINIAKKILRDNLILENTMILYRTNRESLFLMKAFIDFNIRFYVKNFSFNTLNSFVVKDIISYIDFSLNGSLSSLKNIKNKPNRSITNQDIIKRFNNHQKWNFISSRRLNDIYKKGKIIKNLSFTKAVNFILNDIGYKSYAIKYYEINGIDLELLEDVISEFLGLFPENSTLEEGFKQYYSYLSLIDSINFKVNSGVLLTTVHGAKGLEKDNVFIVSLNEGYFPHKRASLENELEEERRLMYVALTRSKKNLYLSYIKSKTNDLKPSVFLDEMKYK